MVYVFVIYMMFTLFKQWFDVEKTSD